MNEPRQDDSPTPSSLELRRMPPLMLAYIGDAVYELRVREHLLKSGLVKMADLHAQAVSYVKAERQSQLYGEIEALLSEQEREVFRHARNAKSGHQPPRTAVAAYRRATGIEALIGYLHLSGEQERLAAIFEVLFKEEQPEATAAETEPK